MNLAERLTQIEARLEIEAALAQWADCLDRNEYDRLAELWGEDCVFSTYENPVAYEADRPALRGADRSDSIARLGGLLSRIGQTHHLIGNVRIELLADTAQVECLVRTYHACAEDGSNGFWESLARMHVALCKRDRWRIVQQDYVVLVGLGSMDIFRRRSGPHRG